MDWDFDHHWEQGFKIKILTKKNKKELSQESTLLLTLNHSFLIIN